MTALLERLPAYKKIILKAIEASSSQDDMMVCLDLVNLFAERFRTMLSYEDFIKHWTELHEAREEKYSRIVTPV